MRELNLRGRGKLVYGPRPKLHEIRTVVERWAKCGGLNTIGKKYRCQTETLAFDYMKMQNWILKDGNHKTE